jgi:hypothetical protein
MAAPYPTDLPATALTPTGVWGVMDMKKIDVAAIEAARRG